MMMATPLHFCSLLAKSPVLPAYVCAYDVLDSADAQMPVDLLPRGRDVSDLPYMLRRPAFSLVESSWTSAQT